MVARRTLNTEPIEVPECSDWASRKLDQALRWHEQRVRSLEEELRRTKEDLARLQNTTERGLAADRSSIRNEVRMHQYEPERPDPSGYRPFTYARQRESRRGQSITRSRDRSRSRHRDRSRSRSRDRRSPARDEQGSLNPRGVGLEVRCQAHQQVERVWVIRSRIHEDRTKNVDFPLMSNY